MRDVMLWFWRSVTSLSLLWLVGGAAAQQQRGSLEIAVEGYLRSQTSSPPMLIPVTVYACVINRSGSRLDDESIRQTLAAIQSSRIPQFLGEGDDVEEVMYTFQYNVSSHFGCEKQAQVVLTVETGVTAKEQERPMINNERVIGIMRVSNAMGSGEINGRVAGWIISATNSWIAPDISRKLFFSLLEDDGIEVSIIGFHRIKDASDPLKELDLQLITRNLRNWLGIADNKTIVKATTRDISDHPAVLAALLRAQQPHAKENYDPVTGRFASATSESEEIDAAEFVKGVAESSDSLFRVGSAARLVRLRRREVEVYVLVGQTDAEQFRDGARLFVSGADIALMVPSSATVPFNLTKHLLLGLVDTVGGVLTLPKDDRWKTRDLFDAKSDIPTWISQHAVQNVVLNELHRSLKLAKEFFELFSTSPNSRESEVRALVKLFVAVGEKLSSGDWIAARNVLRGQVHDSLRILARASRAERKKCCVERISSDSIDALAGETRVGRRYVFLIIYTFVGTVLLLATAAAIWMSRGSNSNHGPNLTAVFGRQHLD